MDKISDSAHVCTDHITGDPQNVLYCKFCKQKITAGITRLKHHLLGTKKVLRFVRTSQLM